MRDEYYRVEGNSQLKKNPRTGTIVNTNVDEIKSAKKRKMIRLKKQREEQELHNKIDKLSDNLSRLEKMFHELLEKEYGNRNR